MAGAVLRSVSGHARGRTAVVPRPFVKWVGGKGQLLPELRMRIDRLRESHGFARYHEPFIGGGALFFELFRSARLGRKKAWLSDSNAELVDTYRAVQDDVDALIGLLAEHKRRHCKDYFYALRAEEPTTLLERAARMIYLNKTAFNGMYRVNSKGRFNVPIGSYKDPSILDERNLRAASAALQKAVIEHRPFDTVLEHAKPGDLVYFDPPYVPISDTSYFTAYARDGFGPDEQRRLAEVFTELAGRGVHVMASNSYAPLVRELYADFRIDRVSATRAINSKADRRGAIDEALVTSPSFWA